MFNIPKDYQYDQYDLAAQLNVLKLCCNFLLVIILLLILTLSSNLSKLAHFKTGGLWTQSSLWERILGRRGNL